MRKEIKDSIDRYVEHRAETGGFLRAVLENDLFRAIMRVDKDNCRDLKEICDYIYFTIPGNCWGSYGKVRDWLNGRE